MNKKTARNKKLIIINLFIIVLIILLLFTIARTTGFADEIFQSKEYSKLSDLKATDDVEELNSNFEETNPNEKPVEEVLESEPVKVKQVEFKVDEKKLAKQKQFLELAGKDNIIIEYSYEKPLITKDSENKDIITISKLNNLNNPGEPEVPFEVVMIMLPADKDVDEVKVIPDDKVDIKGAYNLKTGDWQIPISQAGKVDISEFEKNKTIFNKYPNNYYSNPSTQIKKGYKFVIFNIYPVEYQQKKQKLFYYPKFTVVVTLKPGVVPKSFRANNTEDKKEIQKWVISQNSNLVAEKDLTYEKYQEISRKVSNKTNLSALYTYNAGNKKIEDGRNQPNIIPDTVSYKYIIVTKREFGPSFQPLITWKTTRPNNPITAKIFYMEDILADSRFSCTGEYNWGDGCGSVNQFNDDAAKLRNFIRFAYTTFGTEYVLLGGDADYENLGPGTETEDIIVPSRYIASSSANVSENMLILSDVYFSNLDNSFDSDNDGIFTLFSLGFPDNSDYLPDVAIGRAPFDNAVEINNWVNKIIVNEQIINYNDLNYLFIAEYLGFPGNNFFGGTYLDKIINGSSNDGFSTIGFSTINPNYIYKLYENYQNYSPPANNGFSSQDLINLINLRNPYIINHIGHGGVNSFMKLTSYSEESDITFFNLMNTLTTTTFFLYSGACYAGAFDNKYYGLNNTEPYDSISEKLLAAPTGPSSIISNSLQGGLDIFPRLFWDNVFFKSNKNIGKINNISKEQFYLRNQQSWVYLEKNLLGDSETSFLLPTLNNKLSLELLGDNLDATFYLNDFNIDIIVNNLTDITYTNIGLHIFLDDQEVSLQYINLNPGSNQINYTLNSDLYSSDIGEYKSIKIVVDSVVSDESFDNVAEKILFIYNLEWGLVIDLTDQNIDCNTTSGQNILGITDNKFASFYQFSFSGNNFILKNCEFISFNKYGNSGLYFQEGSNSTIEYNSFKHTSINFDIDISGLIIRNNNFYTSFYNFPNIILQNDYISILEVNDLRIYNNKFISKIDPRYNSNYNSIPTIMINDSTNVDINNNDFDNITNILGTIAINNSDFINLYSNNFNSTQIPYGSLVISGSNLNGLNIIQNNIKNQKFIIDNSNLVIINNNHLLNSNVILEDISNLVFNNNYLNKAIDPNFALLTLHSILPIESLFNNKICTTDQQAINLFNSCNQLNNFNSIFINNIISSIGFGGSENNCPELLPQHGINYCYCNEKFAPGGVGCVPDPNYQNILEMDK